ncbi:MAG: hypothetical protein HXX15_21390 [Rhodopseudomonas sp.]|uniref:hypothetical protein n=1 Tax=Rhodopseudomonas sp. TaxID=1078 RepID=UPI00178DA787|nr:hypothetical protein [Rhodopseudomonas sp.]NVN88642.1 hypothetical protein [Rhodopseudomonas sp.]
MVDWTDDRIAALSDKDLKTLLVNAERKSATEVIEKCKTALETRDAAKPRKGPKPRTEVKEFEHQMAGELAAVGTALAATYDLSEETAKAHSAGVKGFKAHRLLDAKGFAKLGGMQRDGSVAIDRYISYRRGADIVSLSVFLLKDQPLEAHEFHVIAPRALLDGGKPIAEIRPTATPEQKQSADSGLAFRDLPNAAAAFETALAKITA